MTLRHFKLAPWEPYILLGVPEEQQPLTFILKSETFVTKAYCVAMTKLNFSFCFSFRTKTVLGHTQKKIKAQNNLSYILGTDSALPFFFS